MLRSLNLENCQIRKRFLATHLFGLKTQESKKTKMPEFCQTQSRRMADMKKNDKSTCVN